MHANGKYECEKHKIKFTFKGLQSHNIKCHNGQKKQDETTPCPICKVKFSSPSYLGKEILFSIFVSILSNDFFFQIYFSISDQHMKVHTNGNVKCEICNIRFTTASLIHHQRMAHSKLYYGVPLSVRRMRKVNETFESRIYSVSTSKSRN